MAEKKPYTPCHPRVKLASPGEPSKRCRGMLHPEGLYLTVNSFYKNRARHDGLRSMCIDCDRAWEKANPESMKGRAKRWRAKKLGKEPLKQVPGFRDRIKEFAEGGEYEGPSTDEAAERLARYVRGEEYRGK